MHIAHMLPLKFVDKIFSFEGARSKKGLNLAYSAPPPLGRRANQGVILDNSAEHVAQV